MKLKLLIITMILFILGACAKTEGTEEPASIIPEPPAISEFPAEPDFPIEIELAENPASDFEWEAVDGGVEITRYIRDEESVVIPAEINGLPVVSIGTHAFSTAVQGTTITKLKSVIIPDTVTNIGRNAFRQAPLESIIIPDSVTHIGQEAFRYCYQLSSVTIGNSVTHIGGAAFESCAITSIVLPESIELIEYGAFYGCSRLTDITFPDSFIYLHSGVFYDTAWFRNQPDGVVYAGNIAYDFKGDKRNAESLEIREGTLGIAFGAFKNFTSSTDFYNFTSITLPDGLIHIGEQAFWECEELVEVIFPESVTSVGAGAFHGTAWLETHEGVVYINNTAIAFNDSNNTISSVDIREGTTHINYWDLWENTELMNISIPDSVTEIEYYSFRRFKEGLSVTYKDETYNAQMGVIRSNVYNEPDTVIWDLPQEFYNAFNRFQPF